METLDTMSAYLGHGLIGFYFTFFGLWNIFHWKSIVDVIIQKKLPSPLLLLSIAIGWQVIFGVMIMFGIATKLAAIALLPFVLLTTFILHPFWDFAGDLRKQHMALFITNCTMSLGALFLLIGS